MLNSHSTGAGLPQFPSYLLKRKTRGNWLTFNNFFFHRGEFGVASKICGWSLPLTFPQNRDTFDRTLAAWGKHVTAFISCYGAPCTLE